MESLKKCSAVSCFILHLNNPKRVMTGIWWWTYLEKKRQNLFVHGQSGMEMNQRCQQEGGRKHNITARFQSLQTNLQVKHCIIEYLCSTRYQPLSHVCNVGGVKTKQRLPCGQSLLCVLMSHTKTHTIEICDRIMFFSHRPVNRTKARQLNSCVMTSSAHLFLCLNTCHAYIQGSRWKHMFSHLISVARRGVTDVLSGKGQCGRPVQHPMAGIN